jgi:hypothetical protein
MRRLLITAIAAATCLVAGPLSQAATPEKGDISPSKPKANWSGQVGGSPLTSGPVTPCSAPTCDAFILTLKDLPPEGVAGSSLEITMSITGAGEIDMYVVGEGGQSAASNKTNPPSDYEEKVIIADPVPGKYEVQAQGDGQYTTVAELKMPAGWTPGSTGGGSTGGGSTGGGSTGGGDTGGQQGGQPSTQPTPPSGQPSGGGTQQASGATFPYSVRFGRVAGTAKKVSKAKKITVPIRVTGGGPLTNVRVELHKGSAKGKLVGLGTAKRLNGNGKVVVKLKGKITKGAYQIVLKAKGKDGRSGTLNTRVRFK